MPQRHLMGAQRIKCSRQKDINLIREPPSLRRKGAIENENIKNM